MSEKIISGETLLGLVRMSEAALEAIADMLRELTPEVRERLKDKLAAVAITTQALGGEISRLKSRIVSRLRTR
jgi:hypothetical protein